MGQEGKLNVGVSDEGRPRAGMGEDETGIG